jgi:hypothetical protein
VNVLLASAPRHPDSDVWDFLAGCHWRGLWPASVFRSRVDDQSPFGIDVSFVPSVNFTESYVEPQAAIALAARRLHGPAPMTGCRQWHPIKEAR